MHVAIDEVRAQNKIAEVALCAILAISLMVLKIQLGLLCKHGERA